MDSGIDEAWPIVLRAHPASSFAAGTPITWVLPMCDDPTRHMIRSGKTVTATLPWVRLQYSPGDGVAHAGRESLPPAISCHDLRHTAASLLVALVANVMRVRRQRGVRGPVHHSRQPVASFRHGVRSNWAENGRNFDHVA